MQVRRYSRLHHNHAGVVSLSADGSEVAVTTAKASSLDKDYQVTHTAAVCSGCHAMAHSSPRHAEPVASVQVVARVHKGMDMLPRLNALPVDKDDQPMQRITITACGISDAQARACGKLPEQPHEVPCACCDQAR